MSALTGADLRDLGAFLHGCRGAQVHIGALEGEVWRVYEPGAPRYYVQLLFAIPELLEAHAPTLEVALARLAVEVRCFVADLPEELRREVSP